MREAYGLIRQAIGPRGLLLYPAATKTISRYAIITVGIGGWPHASGTPEGWGVDIRQRRDPGLT